MKKNCPNSNLLKLLTTTIMIFFTIVVVGNQINTTEEIQLDTLASEEQELLVTNNEVSLAGNEGVENVKNEEVTIDSKSELGLNKGYLVTVNSSNEKFKHVVTTDQDRVVNIFEAYFGTDLDIMKILNHSPYFDMKTDDVYFYAEKGNVREGKDGKLKFKRLKKSRK